MRILVTGAAGFIGFYVSKWLATQGHTVTGIDNLNDYYNVSLKNDRLIELEPIKTFRFKKINISDYENLSLLFELEKFGRVVHLAAQAGVRYSIENPRAYVESNIDGFLNILECCRYNKIEHLLYASSSSVYGANEKIPFSEEDQVDHPLSFYAASKKANESMAHTYSHLYQLPTTGLRFFTVYGPWGRPDMSPFLFAKSIMEGKPLKIFNNGKHQRDFTYIDDIVQGVIRTLDVIPSSNPKWSGLSPDPSSSKAPWRLYNIGNSKPVELMYFIKCLEKSLGKTTKKEFLPIQPGDVEDTYADTSILMREVGYKPTTPVETGVNKFVDWFLTYHDY